jgi:hypothetical protein
MKALFVVAALLTSGTAIAQDAATNDGTPERDARGIAVVNDAPNVPAGVNQPVAVPQGAQVTVAPATQFFATRPATAAYPPCERGQTDRCTQTYEGGRRPRR